MSVAVIVTGELSCSIRELERRLLERIGEEQRLANSDNHLIRLLCDAVRATRELDMCGKIMYKKVEVDTNGKS